MAWRDDGNRNDSGGGGVVPFISTFSTEFLAGPGLGLLAAGGLGDGTEPEGGAGEELSAPTARTRLSGIPNSASPSSYLWPSFVAHRLEMWLHEYECRGGREAVVLT